MATEATQQMGGEMPVEDRIEALLEREENPDESMQQQSQPQPQDEAGDEPRAQREEAEAETEEEVEVEAKADESEPEDDVEELELDASQVAAIFGLSEDSLSVDDDGNIKVRTKIDGQPGEATLEELVRSYQLEGHIQNKSAEMSERVRQFEDYARQSTAQLQEHINQLQMMQGYEEQLIQQAIIGDDDMETLRIADPGAYAAKQMAIREQMEGLYARRQAASQHAQMVQQQREMQQQQAYQNHVGNELETLLANHKELGTEDNFNKFRSDSIEHLQKNFKIDPNNPYQTAAVSAVVSNYMGLKLLMDSMELARLKGTTEVAKKKVIKKPKLVKAGASKTKVEKAATQFRDDMGRFHKGRFKRQVNSLDDAAALIEKHFL